MFQCWRWLLQLFHLGFRTVLPARFFKVTPGSLDAGALAVLTRNQDTQIINKITNTKKLHRKKLHHIVCHKFSTAATCAWVRPGILGCPQQRCAHHTEVHGPATMAVHVMTPWPWLQVEWLKASMHCRSSCWRQSLSHQWFTTRNLVDTSATLSTASVCTQTADANLDPVPTCKGSSSILLERFLKDKIPN